jgi:hypothetical protein
MRAPIIGKKPSKIMNSMYPEKAAVIFPKAPEIRNQKGPKPQKSPTPQDIARPGPGYSFGLITIFYGN